MTISRGPVSSRVMGDNTDSLIEWLRGPDTPMARIFFAVAAARKPLPWEAIG